MKKDTVFNITQYPLNYLMTSIDGGDIALPDLQRPFVWKNVKVRDLFDSLYKGLPVGMLILWKINESNDEFQPIGVLDKNTTPTKLIIDGQQRLTALYSVITGSEVIDSEYKQKSIKISYNPFTEEFEVQNSSILKDPTWVSNITDIFKGDIFSFMNEFFENLDEKRPDFEYDKLEIQNNINSLKSLENSYQFSAIELSPSLDPEEVSEIFVRINSTGKTLNQSDFIFTLMSLYWPEGKNQLEEFSKKAKIAPVAGETSSFNLINAQPTNENLLRTIIGYSFLRGRLKYAYLILKGRNLENQTTTEEERVKNFDILKEGLETALNLVYWHDFIAIIQSAGFVNDNLILSKNAIYETYALYLLGRCRFNIKHMDLESIIRKWFVFSLLTQRYGSSPESRIEHELSNFRESDDLIGELSEIINSSLTNDYWTVTLPSRLESSQGSRNSSNQVYNACKVFEGENILFSEIKLKDYLSPFVKSPKKQIEVHHIFPKNYLQKVKNLKQKDYNQIANMIYIDYHKNIKISDKPPHEYWSEILDECSDNTRDFVEKNYVKVYDLPYEFWKMDYFEFLEKRRHLMAESMHRYFEKL